MVRSGGSDDQAGSPPATYPKREFRNSRSETFGRSRFFCGQSATLKLLPDTEGSANTGLSELTGRWSNARTAWLGRENPNCHTARPGERSEVALRL